MDRTNKDINISIILIIIILSFLIIIYTLPDLLKYKIPSFLPRQLTVYDKETNKDIPINDLSFNGIPAKIHQIFRTSYVTKCMYDTIRKNLDNNIEFEYYFYNNRDALKFISENFIDDVVRAYNSLDDGPFKSDLCKYCILYTYGGVYIDPHLNINTKLIDYVSTHSLVFTRNETNNFVSTAVMIAPPGLDIFRMLIDILVNIINNKNNHISKHLELLYSQELLSKLITERKYDQYVTLKLKNNICDIDSNKIIFNSYTFYNLDKYFL